MRWAEQRQGNLLTAARFVARGCLRNIRGVRVAYARSLGVYEVIGADHLVITESALDVVEGLPAEPEKATAEAPAENAQAEPTTQTDTAGEAE